MRQCAVLLVAVLIAAPGCGSSSSSPSTTTPPAVTLTGVTVTGSAPAIGATSQFTANGSFSNGTSQNVTSSAAWQSSNTAVATVNAAGVVTGVNAGQAVITATYQGLSGQNTVTLVRSGFTVTGTITDSASGAALPGASISSSDGKSTTATGSGTYSLSGLTGNVTLTASNSGYVSTTRSVNVTADTRVDFALTRTPSPLGGQISVQGTPCVAAQSGPVSCTFVATGVGGTAPYAFQWTFINSANNTNTTAAGPTASPQLGCNISTGVTTFSVGITLRVADATGASVIVTGSQQIARATGNCGV